MDITAMFAMACVFGIPISAIWTSHRRQMLEMQLKLKNQGGVEVQGAINALREEVRQLRDTSMSYDLSFDAAMQRMENRVENIERRVNTQSAENTVNQNIMAGR